MDLGNATPINQRLSQFLKGWSTKAIVIKNDTASLSHLATLIACTLETFEEQRLHLQEILYERGLYFIPDAVFLNHTECLSFFMDHLYMAEIKAQMNCKDRDGYTAFQYCILDNSPDMLKFVLVNSLIDLATERENDPCFDENMCNLAKRISSFKILRYLSKWLHENITLSLSSSFSLDATHP
jgi:hypothetical protein